LNAFETENPKKLKKGGGAAKVNKTKKYKKGSLQQSVKLDIKWRLIASD